MTSPSAQPVALVAGATRGAGRAIAVELARAGFQVVATGRSSRVSGPSDQDKPETIEETADLAGPSCQARVVDHTSSSEVAGLVAWIESSYGRLDVLVNDMFGGDAFAEWGVPLWSHDLANGLRMLELGVHSHLVTLHHAVPLLLSSSSPDSRGLLIEVTDGNAEVNRTPRPGGVYYDLVKAQVQRIIDVLARDAASLPLDVIGVTPGWLRSESMLRGFGVSESNWRDFCAKEPSFGISESPTYVARGVAALASDGARPSDWRGRVMTARELSDRYGVTDADGSRPDCWGLLAEFGWDADTPEAIAAIERYR
ncbi:MAG: SDR family NAD(P)-dependent oxidoreductase [Nocardioides sp.]|jgi:NAD(P)-dependent dehydrogenase (short-subunit alcohol dehydrogenase family)